LISQLRVCLGWEEGLFVGLGVRDLVDHEANTALGDDVGGAVTDLDADDGVGGIDAQHGEEVHDGVGAPRDHGHDLSGLDLAADHWVSLGIGGCGQTDEELVDDVQEKSHGHEPAHPARGQVAGHDELSVITGDDHEGGAEAEGPGLAAEGLVIEFHHQEDLDQQKGHGQEPVHVSVCIVERHTGQGWGPSVHGTTFQLACGVVVSINPGVENTDVMVSRNERDQTGNDTCGLVLVGDSHRAEPQKHGGGHHGRQCERQAVVNCLVLQICHCEHHHVCKN